MQAYGRKDWSPDHCRGLSTQYESQSVNDPASFTPLFVVLSSRKSLFPMYATHACSVAEFVPAL